MLAVCIAITIAVILPVPCSLAVIRLCCIVSILGVGTPLPLCSPVPNLQPLLGCLFVGGFEALLNEAALLVAEPAHQLPQCNALLLIYNSHEAQRSSAHAAIPVRHQLCHGGQRLVAGALVHDDALLPDQLPQDLNDLNAGSVVLGRQAQDQELAHPLTLKHSARLEEELPMHCPDALLSVAGLLDQAGHQNLRLSLRQFVALLIEGIQQRLRKVAHLQEALWVRLADPQDQPPEKQVQRSHDSVHTGGQVCSQHLRRCHVACEVLAKQCSPKRRRDQGKELSLEVVLLVRAWPVEFATLEVHLSQAGLFAGADLQQRCRSLLYRCRSCSNGA
mmetsp:Transcript_21102/g.63477  ORF Transcript_21102/g.63477 Transcript_21102/m.63477 type:complete len:333 (-) Transcript_21102:3722-4720(-)